jgi:hypothetical protein
LSTSLDWLFVVVAAVYLLIPAFREKPRALGDAGEYMLMAESLYNHGSADLRDEDLRSLLDPESTPRIDGPLGQAQRSYIANGNGQAYGIHFWAYPLLCLPAKALLRALHGNELKAFQLTNAALFLLTVVVLQRRGGATGRLLAAFLLLSPAAAFVLWPHPEVFSCSLVAISLVFWREGRATAATFAAALASLQAAPLVVLAALFWWQARSSRALGVRALAPTLGLLLAAWPFIFYLLHYGLPTLLPLVGAVDLAQASLGRVGEIFFDLNLGMLPYLALALFGALVAPLVLLAMRPPVRPNLEFWAALGAMALLCSVAVNWNHGTAGPSRYAIWMLPLVFGLFVQMLDPALGNAQVRCAFGVLAVAAFVSQTAVVVSRGGLHPSMDHLRHSYLAAFVLEHEPGLYNPSPEIFAERTLGYEVPYGAIPNGEAVVYRAHQECRKALAQKRHWTELLTGCGSPRDPPDFSRLASANQRGTWLYVDY